MLNVTAPDNSKVYLNDSEIVEITRTKKKRGKLSLNKIWLHPKVGSIFTSKKNVMILEAPDAKAFHKQDLKVDIVWADKLKKEEVK